MSQNVLDIRKERGFIQQTTDEETLRETLSTPTTCYIGFDPTAPTLHAGSLVPIMALAHMQHAGHNPIALLGGGTGLIGDPSGKTELRKMLTAEDIVENGKGIKEQFSRYLNFDGGAKFMNNADWLTQLNYIEFLRDVGIHFSVNRMLAAESYKARLETGLNFIEFNYMILQAYDFLVLSRTDDCVLQMGGNDQWGNIVAGVDLIRRCDAKSAHAITFPLLTTSSGVKMGKTAKGALWLDAGRTSPYDFYQYWINTEDPDVEKCLSLLTFLPMDEVRRLGALEGAEIRKAKEVLAFEVTKLCHGEDEAQKAKQAAKALFSGGADMASVPTFEIDAATLAEGIDAFVLFADAGLCKSRGEARRLITQGGGYVNGKKLEAFDRKVTESDLEDGAILLRAGKKKYMAVKPV